MEPAPSTSGRCGTGSPRSVWSRKGPLRHTPPVRSRLTDHQLGVALVAGGMLVVSVDSLGFRLTNADSWDNTFWYAQLQERFGELMLPPVRLRAAVAEAAAQALPVGALGKRPGASDATEDFGAVWAAIRSRYGGSS